MGRIDVWVRTYIQCLGERYYGTPPYLFFFCLGQPACVNDVQGISLLELPKMKLLGYQIAEEGFTLGGLYRSLLRAIKPEI